MRTPYYIFKTKNCRDSINLFYIYQSGLLDNINYKPFDDINDIFFRINDLYKNLFNLSLSINIILQGMPENFDFDAIEKQIKDKKLCLRTIEKEILNKCRINDELNLKKQKLSKLISDKDTILNNTLIKINELGSDMPFDSKLNLTAFIKSLYSIDKAPELFISDIEKFFRTNQNLKALYLLLDLKDFINIQKQIYEIENFIDNYFDASCLKNYYDSVSDDIRQLESVFFNKDVIRRNKMKLDSLFNEFADILLSINKLVIYFIATLRGDGFLLGGLNYD